MTILEKTKIDACWFELSKGYEPSMKGLKKYRKEFNRCNDEIFQYTRRLNYKKYYNHGLAIINTFKSKSTNIMKKLNIENITPIECATFEKSFNGGLLHLEKDIIGKKTKCYGYDFSNCYGNFLADFDISELYAPIPPGTYTKFNEFDINDLTNLKYGLYNIEISSEHPIILKYFQFSADHWYNIISLQQLQSLVKYIKDKDAVKFKVLGDCLVWDNKDLVKCDVIFSDWFKYVNDLKTNLKGNMLVKNLSTKLWGYLTQFNRIFVNGEDVDEYDFLFYDDINDKRTSEYMCIDVSGRAEAGAKRVFAQRTAGPEGQIDDLPLEDGVYFRICFILLFHCRFPV